VNTALVVPRRTLLALGSAVAASAAMRAWSQPPALKPHFVAADALDLREVQPPWPADGTLAGEADLDTVLAAQALRSPSDIQAARDDAGHGPQAWLGSALGAEWVIKHASRFMPLLDRVRADLDPYAHVSPHPRRTRPSERDARVQPVVAFSHGAYPSARTQATLVWAEVVGELHPDVLASLQAHAARSAWLRVVGGVHYPTDLEGGRRVARAFLARLRASAAYRAERDAMR